MTRLFVMILESCLLCYLINSIVVFEEIDNTKTDSTMFQQTKFEYIEQSFSRDVMTTHEWDEIIENGLSTYKVKNKQGYYGLIDINGDLIIQDIWTHIYVCSDDRVFCEGFPKWGDVALYDMKGSLISSRYIGGFISDFSYQFAGGVAAVHTVEGDFFINVYGDQISETYVYATGFSAGYAIVQNSIDSELYIVDMSFNIIGLPNNTVLYNDKHMNANFIIEDSCKNIYILDLKSSALYGPFTEVFQELTDSIILCRVDNGNNVYFSYNMAESVLLDICE